MARKRRDRSRRSFQSKKLQERVKKGTERVEKKWGIIQSGLNIPMWRPKDGSHIVDVIPYYAGKFDSLTKKGDPTYTLEFYVHTNVGIEETSFLCPAEMFGEPCPICEERQRIREAGEKEEVWKKLFPRRRNLYNVISYDAGDEQKGIMVWDVSYYYFEKMVMAISQKIPRSRGGKIKQKQIVNFADPENGKSISFTIEPPKSKKDFAKYVGHTFDERDYEINDDVLDSTYTLDEIIKQSTYEEIEAAYFGEKSSRKTQSKDNNENDDLLDELEGLEDIDELKDFIDENGIEIKIKRSDDEEDIKEKIIDFLENQDSSENKFSFDDIQEMSKMKLKKVIKECDLSTDLLDEAENTQELRDLI